MEDIKELQTFGFELVGKWFLDYNDKINFDIDNSTLAIEDVLYAFEAQGIIKYVGITEQSVRSRMINYKSGHEDNMSSGTTNKIVNREIKKLLNGKINVSIYILKGEAICDYFGLRISLSTGIEKSLITKFNSNEQLWNRRGVKSNNIQKIVKNNTNLLISNILPNQMVYTLGKEAFSKGYVLFKNEVNNLLPLESEGMDVHYDGKTVTGWFTRSSNNKKVNGYSDLKEYFNNHFKLKDKVLITVINANEIKIDKYENQ